MVGHENDCAHHTTPPQKLNVGNISAVTDPILTKLWGGRPQSTKFWLKKFMVEKNFV